MKTIREITLHDLCEVLKEEGEIGFIAQGKFVYIQEGAESDYNLSIYALQSVPCNIDGHIDYDALCEIDCEDGGEFDGHAYDAIEEAIEIASRSSGLDDLKLYAT